MINYDIFIYAIGGSCQAETALGVITKGAYLGDRFVKQGFSE